MRPQHNGVWIAGTCRDEHGRLSALLQDSTGACRIDSIDALLSDVGAVKGKRKRARIPLVQLIRSDTKQYLEAIGLGHLKSDGQATYEVMSDIGQLVIPAQLLILSILGNYLPLREILLSPMDPAQLMAIDVSGDQILMRALDLRPGLSAFCKGRLPQVMQWLQTYPSARAAWGSVYRNALDGNFDLVIPAATLSVSVHFHIVGGKHYVTQLVVADLFPEEKSFAFASAVAQEKFIFSDTGRVPYSAKNVQKMPTTSDALLSGKHPTNISDEQWRQIEDILYGPGGRSRIRRHSLQMLVETIVHKLSIGCPWPKAHALKNVAVTATSYYSTWKRSGQWSKVMKVLA